jgi:cellulose synthase/poly-beta-1,6-N-acetylglucosamine synthase-like glycosyltransferase
MTELDQSINGLRRRFPELSAAQILSRGQARTALALGALVLTLLIWNPRFTVRAALLLATLVYLVALGYRCYLADAALRRPSLLSVSDAQARAIPDEALPVYTVLIPAYHEREVIGRTLKAMAQLEYPQHLLDVKLLLEEDDRETIAAAVAAVRNPNVEIVRIPAVGPRTKPKACNYGLLSARGEFVTIFDAEDRPEPLQLRRAVAAFWRSGSSVACLQAKLSYHNPNQNLITRWFTVEYLTWFSVLLPAQASMGGPVPLGGTSMHIRRRVLDEAGAWDPYNVTEDADLGVRLLRMGYRTVVLDSTTHEEANSDFVNWVKQRSRWYKGYLQTWLVHMRHPLRLRSEIGLRPLLTFSLLIVGTPIIALINPAFWLLTFTWFAVRPHFINAMFEGWIYYPSLFCLVVGNTAVLYLSLLAIRMTGNSRLVPAVALMPIYWLMMSVAAVKAIFQLLTAPSFWEKTAHGLDQLGKSEVVIGG